ncbi:MAG: crotonase/enoyl-CoA hydratase family protein [Solirubrobacteraceae bacterium]|nr:crotonase/enoyl-CoA hydratase family protein [Solirubrobacteraceae bacterium]
MAEQRVSIEIVDHVADVRMTRGDKHNGLDGAMFAQLREAAGALRDDRSVRAVVLSGDGPSFCAGLDVQDAVTSGALAQADSLDERLDGELVNAFQAVAYDWRRVPVPVIAAVHGNCFGGGMQIALGADIRLVAPDARLSIMEIKWGLIPDMALTVTLPPLMRRDVAMELMVTGRIVSGAEGVELGLGTRVADDPRDAALTLAREIAGKSPDAIRFGKRLLQDTWTADDAESLMLESRMQKVLIGSPNQMETVQAQFGKRAPEYADASLDLD